MDEFYFVGNAHLDPVWLWRWQEGSAEAKATVRSALDRMNEYPDFKFVCACASVYKWIEDFAPQMFAEVKARVAEGRFIIVGGQHVQPDCNLPSGEGFARHSLYSQRYFYDRFGKVAKIGYNVDSFGHNLMMPAILKKSGINYYVFMRPGTHENDLAANLFCWRSPDGSEVIAHRLHEPYCFNMKDDAELEQKLTSLADHMPKGINASPVFYGVGNHGGGPTKQNIELILESARRHPERRCVFSDLVDFFKKIEPMRDELYLHTEDLQHHASGCYSAVSLIKTLIRKSENAILCAETANMIGARLANKAYATEKIAEAWENVLFCHFHDVMGGCSIESAYTDAQYMLGESISVAERIKNSAFQTVSWAIDTSDSERGYPIVIFNTLPFDREALIQINRQPDLISSNEGYSVPIQHVFSETFLTGGRSDTVFKARVPAMGYTVYYMKNGERTDYESTLRTTEYEMENEYIRVEFDKETGYIKRIFDKVLSADRLSGFGAVPVVIDEEGHDTWSHGKNFFVNVEGKFKSTKIEVLERGPVRAMIMVESSFGRSTLKQYFSLEAGSKELSVSAVVDFHEQHKMLKIAFETAAVSPRAYYEIPFGVIERPCDGEEESGYRWFALKDSEITYAIINSNKYSFSAEGSTMYLSVLRTPYYAHHGRPPIDRCRFTDQGEHRFEYAFICDTGKDFTRIIRRSRVFNTAPEVILENNHNGHLPTAYRGIVCDNSNVEITALKRSEDGHGTVLRFYETAGKESCVRISGDLIGKELELTVSPFSINTYYLDDSSNEWREVLLTEFDI